ncbi:STM3941 family protein [Polaribacter sp. PL03]|uniref:STM3941 family protein n=1 Tax=Polaribacter sp. PL03 TaxID=3088353 RepID=UPI0029CE2647|nr:STM3941 family protein [Polaribacter sp. PL03]MDX6748147.1 STM3941 family protein [Polaribacter sp. PL03]
MKKEEIIIKKDRFRMIILMLPSLIFVVLGFWIAFLAPELNLELVNGQIIKMVIGLLSITFFGFGVILILKKFLDNKYGIKISQEGIYENSSAQNIGLIKWENIERIEAQKVMNRKYIRVIVDNPEEFIKKQNNSLVRKILESNFKRFDSPIQIYTNTLEITFKELFDLINNELTKRK